MALQRKPKTSLLQLIESTTRGIAPEVVTQTNLLPFLLPTPLNLVLKTKRENRIQKAKMWWRKKRVSLPKKLSPKKGPN